MLQKKTHTTHDKLFLYTRKHQSHHATIIGATPTQISSEQRRRGEHATLDATARSSLFNSKRRTRRRKYKIGENWTPEIPHQTRHQTRPDATLPTKNSNIFLRVRVGDHIYHRTVRG